MRTRLVRAGSRMYRTGDLARWRGGRGAGVPGSCGCAGEGARLPHRAWRDRGGAGCGMRAVAQAAVIAREDGAGGKRLVGYVVAAAGCGAGCGGAAVRIWGGALPELHGAVCVRGAGAAAADAERQARPSCAAGAGAAGGRGAAGAAHAAGGDPVRAVCGGAGARAGRDRRQLLCAGRRQHHVDPAGEPGAQGRAGDHAARGVPASDRGGAVRRLRASVAPTPLRCCRRSPTGALPATPIMHWLLERGGPIDRFSQAMLLQVPAGLRQRSSACGALQALLDHHDALRLRLTGVADAPSGSLEVAPAGAVVGRRLPAADRRSRA